MLLRGETLGAQDQGGAGMAGIDIDGLSDFVEIGRGGFSTVYRARQAAAGRDVAVKVLHAVLDDTTAARFGRECQTLGALSNHPGICTLYSHGETSSGNPYLILELCTGSLADQIKANGPLPWPEAVALLTRVGAAVQAAHDRGVLHRDIKPENILFTAFDQPVLSDFGIARLDDGWHTTTGMVTASIAHAAPEVLDGQPATAASDVWSLASTGYQILTGLSPFRRSTDDSPSALLSRVFRDPPPDLRPAGVPTEICDILEQAMAKDPAERIATMGGLTAALQAMSHVRGRHDPSSANPQFEADGRSDTVHRHAPGSQSSGGAPESAPSPREETVARLGPIRPLPPDDGTYSAAATSSPAADVTGVERRHPRVSNPSKRPISMRRWIPVSVCAALLLGALVIAQRPSAGERETTRASESTSVVHAFSPVVYAGAP